MGINRGEGEVKPSNRDVLGEQLTNDLENIGLDPEDLTAESVRVGLNIFSYLLDAPRLSTLEDVAEAIRIRRRFINAAEKLGLIPGEDEVKTDPSDVFNVQM